MEKEKLNHLNNDDQKTYKHKEKNGEIFKFKNLLFVEWFEKMKEKWISFFETHKENDFINILYKNFNPIFKSGFYFSILAIMFVLIFGFINKVYMDTIFIRILFIGCIFFIFGGFIAVFFYYFFPEFFKNAIFNSHTNVIDNSDLIIEDKDVSFEMSGNSEKNKFKENNGENDITNSFSDDQKKINSNDKINMKDHYKNKEQYALHTNHQSHRDNVIDDSSNLKVKDLNDFNVNDLANKDFLTNYKNKDPKLLAEAIRSFLKNDD